MDRKLVGLTCCGLLLGLLVTHAALAMDPNLVGWWKFDETAGTVAADSSPSGNDGTIEGTAQWTSGRVDGALAFDGATTYVQLPQATGLVIKSLTDCTMALWVRWTGAAETGSSQNIFEFGVSGNCYMYLSPGTNTGGALRYVIRSPLGGGEEIVAAASALNSDWHHVALTINNGGTMTLYLDGAVAGSTTMTNNRLSYVGATFYHYIGRGTDDPPFFKGRLDDFYIFSRVLSPAEIVKLQLGGALERDLASRPSPADTETDVLRDVVLRWTPGISAATHNVYLGADSDAVKDAGIGSSLLVSQGETAPSYVAGRLEFGRTYYWRVDEVDATANHTVFRGEVWSFTVEPYAYPIPTASITATASSFVTGRGPEKTIDGSGLNADDMHSTVLNDMWQTAKGTTLPAWIQYEFDKPYKLSQMQVWNYNGESFLAIQGMCEVTVEHSMDGIAWTPLAGVSEFPMASGTTDYVSDITVDLGDAVARYVRITAQSNYGGGFSSQCGLSEVRLMAVPTAARNPSPEPDANNVYPSTTLTWRPGREADHHLVYLSDEENAVRQGTAPVYTADESQLAGSQLDLRLGQTYYWRVDEVNEAETPSVWPGDTWAFSTAEYLVVDDFESYTNDSPNRVFQAWIDGLGFSADEFFPDGNSGNGTGAIIGYDPAAGPIMEYTIVHGGLQSMPLSYDGPSETTRTFEPAQDWTRGGVTMLVLFFQGAPDNVAGELYVKINGTKVPYSGDAGDLTLAEWKQWNIDLPAAAGPGAVNTLTIGVSGGQGLLYIDDIRLE